MEDCKNTQHEDPKILRLVPEAVLQWYQHQLCDRTRVADSFQRYISAFARSIPDVDPRCRHDEDASAHEFGRLCVPFKTNVGLVYLELAALFQTRNPLSIRFSDLILKSGWQNFSSQ